MRCAAVHNQLSGLADCFGTPAYMAPEASETKAYEFSADVHSFGKFLSVASTTVLVGERTAFRRRAVDFPLWHFS
jgi:hypothetical protein